MKRILLSTIAGGLLVCATVGAQDRSGFNGTWIMDMSRSESAAQAADAAPKRPVTMLIVESADQFIVERHLDGQSDVVHYRFGAPTESKPAATSGSDATTIESASARWNTGRVETVTVMRINGRAVTRTATYTVDASNRRLTVETETVVQHGYESVGGRDPGNRGVVTDIYVKGD